MRSKVCQFGVIFGIALLLFPSGHRAAGQEITFALEEPALDRWNYPFNAAPGTRPTAPVFCVYLETDFFPGFDQRDGQFLLGFATGGEVSPGLGTDAYTVTAARVTVMTAANNTFRYSLLEPPWQWYRPPDDPEFICAAPGNPDPCPPGNTILPTPALKLFGAGFRNGFTPLTYQENTPFSPFGAFGKRHRTVYALDFDDAGQPRDVSNNVEDGFDPNPFALGTTLAVELGQLVPVNTTFTFEIDVDNPHTQEYLREALDRGFVYFSLATLHLTEQETGGSAPEFYTKENILVDFGLADAAGLQMTVILNGEPPCAPADLNCDGSVGVPDLLILLANWGPCPDPAECPADLTGSESVGVADLLVLLANWG